MNDYITVIAIVLFGLGVVLELLATRIPDLQITGDFSKLICSGQYEMAVTIPYG